MILKKNISLFILLFILQYSYGRFLDKVLMNMKKLKILENRNSELIAEGKDFEHFELSYVWYDKHFKNVFWNIEKNNLYIRTPYYNRLINIEELLTCKQKHNCKSYPIISAFLKTYPKRCITKFIKEINDVIILRSNLIK